MLGKHQVFDNLHVHVSSITMSAEETGDKVFIPRKVFLWILGCYMYIYVCPAIKMLNTKYTQRHF